VIIGEGAGMAMVKLTPVTQEEFQEFLERDIREYAAEKARAGHWAEAEALEKSRLEHERLLPDGPKTRDHHLYTIRAEEDAVGMIWLKASLDSPRPTGFIYDLFIAERFRRKGYASQAMLQLEEVARGLGLQQLGLHVFAHNQAAVSLYERLGYRVSSLNMAKDLPA
jgi:ribosomal protein S18 acetylase RimI-like enzyme